MLRRSWFHTTWMSCSSLKPVLLHTMDDRMTGMTGLHYFYPKGILQQFGWYQGSQQPPSRPMGAQQKHPKWGSMTHSHNYISYTVHKSWTCEIYNKYYIYNYIYIYILYIYILYVTISYRCTYRMHAWPAKYLRLLSLHMLLFDHGRFGGHWTADHVDCGGRQLMAGGVGKRKDTGRLSTAQLIKSRHQRFWMFLDSSVFCYFDCEGYSLKEYPFWVPPVVRPSGANHTWVTPTRSGGESLECRGLERVATQRGSLYIW